MNTSERWIKKKESLQNKMKPGESKKTGVIKMIVIKRKSFLIHPLLKPNVEKIIMNYEL